MTIKEIRLLTGLSQRAFAEKYNIPVRSIENWEAGKRACPPYLPELLEFKVKHDVASKKEDKAMTNDEIREMLRQNTNMTESDIKKHIRDGVLVYASREEAIDDCIAALMGREEAEECVDDMEEMTYDGRTYLVDFVL